MSKEKKIYDFARLIHDVLWTEKSKNKKLIDELKDLILVKKKLDFTKEEFMNEIFLSDELFPHLPFEDYDEEDEFKKTFYEDSYDAVTFQTSSYSTIILLKERINDFHLLLDKKYGVDNVVSYK